MAGSGCQRMVCLLVIDPAAHFLAECRLLQGIFSAVGRNVHPMSAPCGGKRPREILSVSSRGFIGADKAPFVPCFRASRYANTPLIDFNVPWGARPTSFSRPRRGSSHLRPLSLLRVRGVAMRPVRATAAFARLQVPFGSTIPVRASRDLHNFMICKLGA